ncbi:uncharacterized protein MELLADRAFT_64212 [Melampsora larici-populina 98AG31]|uniref:Secreted protein n=1 Tax=Melampsora larici-populina (strain 98AG31 / pathotype 3-4-7) TaxID=747676 RepID=F4RQE8_MELLP|nr:uncharacterized protein MELLADRAFT_64212 [Melampsora larici-populina 98AG31]EGG05396.1 hypothetical protein MELLADRAFT_64212 [Melampsora larici-populina 98AG31]
MTTIHWYIFLLSMFQSTFCHLGSIGRNPFLKSDWEDFTKKISPLKKLKQSQHDTIIAFWKRNIPKDLHDLLVYYPSLIAKTNDLIISKNERWAGKMTTILQAVKPMFLKYNGGPCKVIHQLLTLEKIPFNVLQRIHHWLLEIYVEITHVDSPRAAQLREKIEGFIKISQGKYMDYISSLGHGEILKDFQSTQKRLGGIFLAGDWSSTNQRELAEFWMPCESYNVFACYTILTLSMGFPGPHEDRRELYNQVKHQPELQLVLETQYLQTRLIRLKHIGRYAHEVGRQVLAHSRSDLLEKSETVVNYIKSLKCDVNIGQFIRTQNYISPYGLEIDNRTDVDQMKVIQFWATQDFVVKDFDEVSHKMREFLKTVPICTARNTALAQFLKFYSINTQSTETKEVAEKALDEFVKKSVAKEAQDQPVNNEVLEELPDQSVDTHEVPEELQDHFVNNERADGANDQSAKNQVAEKALSHPRKQLKLHAIYRCFGGN